MRPFIVLLVLALAVPALATDYVITGGYFGTKTFRNYDTLLMTGGGGDRLTGEDYSFLNIQNTSPLVPDSGGIWALALWDSSRLNFSGGQVSGFYIDDYATAILSGGRIDNIRNESQLGFARIEIICKEYNYNTLTKKLTGVWGDDSDFNIQLADLTGYVPTYNILEFTIIPEPATLILLAVGGLLIRKTRR